MSCFDSQFYARKKMSILAFSCSGSLCLLQLLSFVSMVMSQRSLDGEPTFPYAHCPPGSNNTASTKFMDNLGHLFKGNLYDESGKSLYYNTTDGEPPDKVYSNYICRFDFSPETCQNCVDNAINSVVERCNGTKEAIVWYPTCMVRYSDRNFFSTLETVPSIYSWSAANITQPFQFVKILNQTFADLIAMAPSNPSKYAIKEGDISDFERLYSLAQCTQDLSTEDCRACLNTAFDRVTEDNMQGKQGGRVLIPSCFVRYELFRFYEEPEVVGPPGPISPPNKGRRRKKNSSARIQIAIITASVVIVIVLFSCFLWCMWRRCRRDKEEKTNSQETQLLPLGERRIGDDCSYDILRGDQKPTESQDFPMFPLNLVLEATQHFSDENKLGEGGFGIVYKGILEDAKEIAVKRLSRASGQGLREFRNEVTLIAKLQHKNLVRVLGCCLEGSELLLIYEFMPNKSLDLNLFDTTRSMALEWKTRINIINGIARGLLYLHEDSRLRIIHRDLKASNILLDYDMNPKISDFGMARIFGGNQNEANTNRVVGTYGYMAPEYAMEGLFSIKSDVFSFGVLLLEIISGKKNGRFYRSEHGLSLLNYAWKLWCEGEALELMDPVVMHSCDAVELMNCIHIGLLCVQEDPTNRPTMSSVVVMLASDSIQLPQPTQPAFSVGRVVENCAQSSSDGKVCSINEVTVSNVLPR
ncbi:hypothetical protein ACOSQ4_013076 [Xanthoceras sorbifolium]